MLKVNEMIEIIREDEEKIILEETILIGINENFRIKLFILVNQKITNFYFKIYY